MFGRNIKSANYLPRQYRHYRVGNGLVQNNYRYYQMGPPYNQFSPQWNGNPYFGQGPMSNQMMQPGFQSYNPYPTNQGYQPYQQNNGQQQSQFESVFQNPLQQNEEYQSNQYQAYQNNFPYMNPYPKQSFIPKQPSGMKSILNSFKGQDGAFDINKMVDTAGQMMNAVNQVSSMVKGIGGIFKA